MPSTDPATGLYSDTQIAVRDMFRTVFASEATLAHARAAEPLGFDPRLWERLRTVDAPALGLATVGGVGLAELVVMAEEIGRCIAAVPLIEHTVASRLIERLTGSVDTDIADGTAIATLALHDAVDAPGGSTWRLVPAGAVASVVVGRSGTDLVLTRAHPTMTAPRNHASAPLAHRDLDAATSISAIGHHADMDTAMVEWQLLTAAALVGVAATALDLAVAYASDRHQFGVPIGSFQAVQHSLADLPGMIDGARLLAHEAAWMLDRPEGSAPSNVAMQDLIDLADDRIDDPATLSTMAFLFAAEVAATATHRSLHVHGGYGFAEEYDIQLLYRRARGWALVGGDLGAQYQRLADRLVATATR
jgi:alkylation response protein AidB-like acyl-CoA dehydrogenase